jgi:hypothetical protein
MRSACKSAPFSLEGHVEYIPRVARSGFRNLAALRGAVHACLTFMSLGMSPARVYRSAESVMSDRIRFASSSAEPAAKLASFPSREFTHRKRASVPDRRSEGTRFDLNDLYV